MGYMTEQAKRQFQGAGQGPTHELFVGGEQITEDLKSVRVTHQGDGGGSAAEFTLFGDYSDYASAPVSLWLGYGDELNLYFKGRFRRPSYKSTTGKSSGAAYGPYKLMAEQQLNTNETYQGRTLGYVIYDLANRCSYGPGEVEIINGDIYRVPAGKRFQFHNSCGSVAADLLSEAEFVGADVVGGKRLFRPRPRPGANTSYDELWEPGDYAREAFDADYEESRMYRRVEVSRTNERGVPLFRESRDVDNRTLFIPRANEVYPITDFPGTQGEARNKAEEVAQHLRDGEQPFTFSMPMNPELELFRGFMLITEEQDKRKGATIRRTFSCTVDDQIVLDYSPGAGSSEASGTCFEIDREEIKAEIPFNMSKRYSSVVGG